MTDRALITALRAAAGPRAVITAPAQLEAAAVDALGLQRGMAPPPPASRPLALVRPASTDAVSAVMRVAHERRAPVVPYGAGTGLMGGARSVAPGIVLDLRRMDRVLAVDPPAETCTVQAGAVLRDVDRALRRHRLKLGHDPWTVGIATVGGAISTNGLGFLGGKYGSMGEQTLGVTAVLADGTVLRTRGVWPRTAGIDLSRLFTGAEGVFGVITEAALRLFPLPETEVRLGYRFASFAAGFAAVLDLRARGVVPALLDYGERTPPPSAGWDPEPPTLYLGFEGFRGEVDAALAEARAVCAARSGRALGPAQVEEFWSTRHDIADRFALNRAARNAPARPAGVSFDYVHVSLPASAVLDYRRAALRAVKRHGVHAVETGIWTAPGVFSMVLTANGADATARMANAVDAALRLAHRHGGSMEYCHGAGLRLAHLMREEHGAGLDVLRAIKRTLDPHGILNPGKLDLG